MTEDNQTPSEQALQASFSQRLRDLRVISLEDPRGDALGMLLSEDKLVRANSPRAKEMRRVIMDVTEPLAQLVTAKPASERTTMDDDDIRRLRIAELVLDPRGILNQAGEVQPTFTDFLLDESRVSDDNFTTFMQLVEHENLPPALMSDEEQKRLMPNPEVQVRETLPTSLASGDIPLPARDAVMSASFGELGQALQGLSAQYPQW